MVFGKLAQRLKHYWLRPTEAQLLQFSLVSTLPMAAFGLIMGLRGGSQAILFDALFAVIDAGMTLLSLCVARLIEKSGSRRFQYGYWHLEPLVAVLNGSILLLLCVYAFVNAVRGLITGGGTDVTLAFAMSYGIVVFCACMALYFYLWRVNRRLKSVLIRIDMRSFLMSASISAALVLGFALAEGVAALGYPAFRAYADSLVLALLVLGLMPAPLRIIRAAAREVFLIAPEAFHRRVRDVMTDVVTRHGYLDFRSYVAKTGRVHVVDVVILVPSSLVTSIVALDGVREEIALALGTQVRLDQWLSIAFTTRAEWI